MESIHIHQRLRPSRYAFLVNDGDLTAALQSVSLNTALWGGVYNAIVPSTPPDICRGLLKAFDPDWIVNLSDSSSVDELFARYEDRFLSPSQLVMTNDNTGRRRLSVGFNILPLIRYVHETDSRLTAESSRAAIVTAEEVGGWPEFAAFAYGSFRWLPELDVNFEEVYRSGLWAQSVDLPELSPPTDGNKLLLPLEFTRYGLRVHRERARLSSHVIFIGDHRCFADLVDFWNIRASGRTAVFVPVTDYRAFDPLIRLVAQGGRYPINQHIENQADLQKGPSLSDTAFTTVCDWIASKDLGVLSRHSPRPRFGMEIEGYVGDIRVGEIRATENEEFSILQNGRMTPVKLISPPYLNTDNPEIGQFSWSVELGMSGAYNNPEFMFSFPNEPAVEVVVRRALLAAPDECRLGRRGIVLQQDWVRSTMHLMPVRTEEVFHALFRQVGFKVEPSLPGRYAEQIIKKMGSLHLDCRVFKIRGVREILDRLGDGSTLTRGNIYQAVTSVTPDQYGQNWRADLYSDLVLRHGQARLLEFGTIFDVLLEKRILRPGLNFRCQTCLKKDWYHISEFAEEYTCRFCFTTQRVDFGSANQWQFKSDGLFRIPDSAQGSVAVILSLWRFEQLAHAKGSYVASRNLCAIDSERRYEIDYAYIVTSDASYDIVLGQASRFGDFTDDEVQKLVEVSDRFPQRPYLTFSTLKDSYSNAEKTRLRGLAARGYRVIALTREELDPYDLVARFDQSSQLYARGLQKLSENTLRLNVAE